MVLSISAALDFLSHMRFDRELAGTMPSQRFVVLTNQESAWFSAAITLRSHMRETIKP